MTLVREDIEWCQFRWNSTQDQTLPRVLLIGDSIINATWEMTARNLAGQVNVAYFATSKCVGDPDLKRELVHALTGYRWALIYFNNGLHGFSATEPEYAHGLETTLELVLDLAGGAPVIWRSSTPVTVAQRPEEFDPEKNPRVIERNRLAAAIMAKYEIPVDDLYAVVAGRPELSCGDGYHYNTQGREVQATHIAATVRRALGLAG